MAKNIEERIKALQAKLEHLQKEKEKEKVQIPTGKFNLTILDEKGNNIHTLEGFDSRKDAQMMSNKMYKILATKLKQKVSLQIDPEFKKRA